MPKKKLIVYCMFKMFFINKHKPPTNKLLLSVSLSIKNLLFMNKRSAYRLINSIILLLLLALSPAISFSQDIFDRGILPADALPGQLIPILKQKRVALVINQTSV